MARDFERELSDWGRRPARTPPDVAAARVIAGLPAQPWWDVRRLAAAAAVAVLVVSIGAGWWIMQDNNPDLVVLEPPLLDENVVLWWVDPETPVYFALGPPECEEQ